MQSRDRRPTRTFPLLLRSFHAKNCKKARWLVKPRSRSCKRERARRVAVVLVGRLEENEVRCEVLACRERNARSTLGCSWEFGVSERAGDPLAVRLLVYALFTRRKGLGMRYDATRSCTLASAVDRKSIESERKIECLYLFQFNWEALCFCCEILLLCGPIVFSSCPSFIICQL